MISYRIVFVENNGKISGYSITDLHGENETKNRIEGTYNKKNNQFVFEEKEIDYTKSKISQIDFCYVHYTGKVTLNDKGTLKGNFNGIFKNGTKCVNGSLNLVASAKASARVSKVNKKIQKSKKVDQATKDRINLNGVLDSLKVNVLNKDEITSVFLNSATADLEIWDAGKEDGDKIAVYVNDKPVLANYTITHEKKVIKLQLGDKEATIKIEALNSGTIPGNTAKFKLIAPGKEVELMTQLDKDSFTTIKVYRRNQGE
jgi:hypothetical protein